MIEMMPPPPEATPPTEERNRISDVISIGVHNAKIAGHGIAAALSEARMNRAGSGMKRTEERIVNVERKIELHDSFASEYGQMEGLDGRDVWLKPGSAPAPTRSRHVTPKNMFERIEEKRRKRVQGETLSAVIKRGDVLKQYNLSTAGEHMKTRSDTTSFRAKAGRIAEKSLIKKEYRAGNITASELEEKLWTLPVDGHATENRSQRRSRRKLAKKVKKMEKTAVNTFSTEGLEKTHQRKIEAIKKHHHRAEKHKQAKHDLRAERAEDLR